MMILGKRLAEAKKLKLDDWNRVVAHDDTSSLQEDGARAMLESILREDGSGIDLNASIGDTGEMAMTMTIYILEEPCVEVITSEDFLRDLVMNTEDVDGLPVLKKALERAISLIDEAMTKEVQGG